jgi:DNA modification methylase
MEFEEFTLDDITIVCGDSLQYLDNPNFAGKFKLVFADSPYNLKQKYSNYNDNKPTLEFLNFIYNTIFISHFVLLPGGALIYWMHYAKIEYVLTAVRELGMILRNIPIWHYTFGQNQSKKFSPSYTPAVYAIKKGGKITFNADAIRVPSDRQKKYNDKRANPKGKVPNDAYTFQDALDDIYQELMEALSEEFFKLGIDAENTSKTTLDFQTFSRVCGTFKERIVQVPNQFPISMVERYILATTNPGDLVCDPFSGTGTVPYVCWKLKRKCIAIEIVKPTFDVIVDRLQKLICK